MKKGILIIIVLMADIAFASPLTVEIRNNRNITEVESQKNDIHSFANSLSNHLQSKGLEQEIADQKVSRYFKDNDNVNALMAKNITKYLAKIKYEDIITYVANEVLYNRIIDLGQYDHLIGLSQSKLGFVQDNTTLEKIKNISIENKNIKLTYINSCENRMV